MRDTPRQHEASWLRRPRFRFDLKSLFILMTIVGVGFGYRLARQLRADQIRARHFVLVNVVNKNSSTVPPGTSIEPSRGSKWRGTTDNAIHGISCASTRRIGLIVRQPLASKSDGEIADQIISYYGRGLDKLGLDRSNDDTTGLESTERAIWRSTRFGIAVTIDVRVSGAGDAKFADVVVNLMHKEGDALW